MQRSWLLTVLAAGSVVAGACASGGTGGGASAAPSGGAATGGASKGEIIIASDLPVSGADASDGIPTQNGVQFAVESTGTLKGFKLTWKGFDDTVNGAHDPQKGAQNVQQMLNDNKILGMVGPFNSNVAAAEIPVGNRGSLAMVSPSNTNDCLTKPDFGGKPCTDPNPKNLRPAGGNNYFRIAAADSFQGPAMADYAYDTLKLTKVAVWSDNEIFGKGVADTFQAEFIKKGGQVVVRQDFDTKVTNDWKPFLTDAKSKGAMGVYAGATSGTKACIPRAQMAGIIDGPYMTPDGGVNSQCIKDAGSNAASMYGTVAGANAEQNPDAKATVDAFKAKFTKKDDLGSYTFMAYDCAKIIIDAIGRAIDANGGNMPSRQQVVTALGQTKNLKLTTGTYTFDANGDPTTPTMSIFQTKSGDWAFIKQFGVGGS
ncbi:MAG: branched-chain amino acid ABC transporter substrate-binding protein [Chloroflexota bacterium]|nr:branched-chain amino acid ABC transporter substrate-binding protein [Chloroflexota bacterium]MDE3192456.1 branched-chain amino acid ABC transporter substrate-binding protein [Chloroflexota bacterium]